MVVHAKSKKEMGEGETETHRDRDRKRETETSPAPGRRVIGIVLEPIRVCAACWIHPELGRNRSSKPHHRCVTQSRRTIAEGHVLWKF